MSVQVFQIKSGRWQSRCLRVAETRNETAVRELENIAVGLDHHIGRSIEMLHLTIPMATDDAIQPRTLLIPGPRPMMRRFAAKMLFRFTAFANRPATPASRPLR
jgi:hypothetical protein